MAFTPVDSPDFSPQKASIAQEYFDAYYERRLIVDWLPWWWQPQAVVGQISQGVAAWSTIQTWITNNCRHFAQSHNLDGSPRTVADLAGTTADSLECWTWEKLCRSCSMWRSPSEYGWPSVPGEAWPSDPQDLTDTAFELRASLQGDVRGPWVWEFLQRAFKRLIWTTGDRFCTIAYEGGFGRQANSYYLSDPDKYYEDWSQAKSVADGGYDPEQPVNNSYDLPTQYTRGTDYYHTPDYPHAYKAEIFARRLYLKISSRASLGQPWRVTFFGRPRALYNGVWDAHDSGLQENTWGVLQGPFDLAPENEQFTSPEPFGSTDHPLPWCDMPPCTLPGQTASSISRGWELWNTSILIEWTEMAS